MQISVHRIDATRRRDFYDLHSEKNGHPWCFCVAWWVDSFDGWGDRTAEQNRALREAVFDRGDFDGYLLYADGEPAAWCQCCPRLKLVHLNHRNKLTADPAAWVFGCFFVAPSFRGQGLGRELLAGALADLRARGVKRVEALPMRGEGLPADEVWSGPEALMAEFGFTLVRDDAKLPYYRLELSGK
jgi:GNAT superfamily N-acetyltransferase